VIGRDRWRSEPPCVYPPAKAGHIAKRRVGLEFSPSMLEPVRLGALSSDRALCLPTFSHFVIVNKLLSLSSPRCHMAKRRVGEWYSPSYAGARAPRGSVTRQGVALTDLQSLLDGQSNFSVLLSLALSLILSLDAWCLIRCTV
jgi:hypothetical protein